LQRKLLSNFFKVRGGVSQPLPLVSSLSSLEWAAVIVDEAHRIKNPKARVTEVMKALRCTVRIGLTGTILQNNMKELWCVMDWWVNMLCFYY
jgi:SNF2 family DNA or RNA helicase